MHSTLSLQSFELSRETAISGQSIQEGLLTSHGQPAAHGVFTDGVRHRRGPEVDAHNTKMCRGMCVECHAAG